ncbi:MAG: NAD-dependent deacylase [Gemmataceae bacterium]|nr:NAD-dependent deacylase [Gemmataceae bacterium]
MHQSDESADLDRAAELLRQAERVAVLTGAGVSAESGVPTFRDSGGLWEGHRVEDVATPEGFSRDPALVWKFYNLRRAALAAVKPNPGHFALADMGRRWGDALALATQNIDGLHQQAGSEGVLELHGSLARVRCIACPYRAETREALPDLPRCPACEKLLRVDVVWFGEMLPHAVLQAAERAAEACDVFLVVGTSAVVFPAAGLAYQAREAGAKVIECNLGATAASGIADARLHGPSGVLLPELVKRLG